MLIKLGKILQYASINQSFTWITQHGPHKQAEYTECNNYHDKMFQQTWELLIITVWEACLIWLKWSVIA